jgi:hypothetical protein
LDQVDELVEAHNGQPHGRTDRHSETDEQGALIDAEGGDFPGERLAAFAHHRTGDAQPGGDSRGVWHCWAGR